MNIRALAAKAIFDVLERGVSLSVALPAQQQLLRDGKDKALLAEICYGVMRQLPQLDKLVSGYMQKPLKGKQRVIHQLLLVGAYQLYFTRVPAHAAISETAEGCRALKFENLVKVVNGVLRNIQRQVPPLDESNDTLKYNFPGWIIRRLKDAYPETWEDIIEASHQRPPMWLRNNRRHQSRDAYLQALADAEISADAGQGEDAICLEFATDVARLPHFADGASSVQDGAAQWAASLLAPQNGELVLDACAAPAVRAATCWSWPISSWSLWISTKSASSGCRKTSSVSSSMPKLSTAMPAISAVGGRATSLTASCWMRPALQPG